VIIDTVKQAKTETEKEQPWAALGLRQEEYDSIREILGRRPTSSELAMYSVMWSEHCSYKSSKIYLRQFGEKFCRFHESFNLFVLLYLIYLLLMIILFNF